MVATIGLVVTCIRVEATEPARLANVRAHAQQHLALTVATCLLAAAPVFAQAGGDPWTRAVQVLQQSFTTTIARGLALVAIVVGGLGFAYGEGGSKRLSAGIIFGSSMAVLAVNFLRWLFGV